MSMPSPVLRTWSVPLAGVAALLQLVQACKSGGANTPSPSECVAQGGHCEPVNLATLDCAVGVESTLACPQVDTEGDHCCVPHTECYALGGQCVLTDEECANPWQPSLCAEAGVPSQCCGPPPTGACAVRGGQCVAAFPSDSVCQLALGNGYVADTALPSICGCGEAACCVETLNECEQHGGVCVGGVAPVTGAQALPYACDELPQPACAPWQCYDTSSAGSGGTVVPDAGTGD